MAPIRLHIECSATYWPNFRSVVYRLLGGKMSNYRPTRHRYRVKCYLRVARNEKHLIISLCYYFKCLKQRSFKVITTPVRNSQYYIACITMPLNVAIACVPIRFWYQHRLRLWSLLTEALLLVYHPHMLSTSCNSTERYMIGSSRETERANSPVHLLFSISLRDLLSKIPFPLCQNVELLRHVVATLVFVLQLTHLNATAICFPEKS
jgi:hypothetical protein